MFSEPALLEPGKLSIGGHAVRWARNLVAGYWIVLFGVFPLAINYPSIVANTVTTLPPDAMVSLPKLLVLGICWAGGLVLAIALGRDVHFASIARAIRSRSGWGWSLAALLVWIVVAASFAEARTSSPWIGSNARFDGALIQALWWSLMWITWSLARLTTSSNMLGKRAVVAPALVSGILIAGWATCEAYGFEPVSFLNPSIPRASNGNAAASMGHQALVSIYLAALAVGLATYLVSQRARQSSRTSLGVVRFTLLLVANGVLWVGAFASGGRSGVYAGIAVWLGFAAWTLVRRRGSRAILVRLAAVTIVLASAGAVVGTTSRHVQAKTEATVRGGPSFGHRLITWRLGARALAASPLVGYGPDGFANEIWKYATPVQARALLTEFVPPRYVASARRTKDAVVYLDAKHQIHMLRFNYDKVHNYLLDLGVASGLPALLAFLAMVAFGAWRLARSPDRAANAMFCSLATFFIAVQAWFYTLPLDPLIWGWLGVGLAWAGGPLRKGKPTGALQEAVDGTDLAAS